MYSNESEELWRKSIFMENNNKIKKHNQRYESGGVSFELAMNKFGDLSHHEFVARMNGFNRIEKVMYEMNNSSLEKIFKYFIIICSYVLD